MKIESKDVNILFDLAQMSIDNKFWPEDKPKFHEIDTELLEDWNEHLEEEYELEEDDSIYSILNDLTGWEFKFIQKGDHRNDGQLVDYTLILKPKSGKSITISTEMCLMMGFNHWESVEF